MHTPESYEEKLDLVLDLIRRLTIKLFGDLDSENARGRLPQLERRVDEHEKRIRNLESLTLRWIGGAVAVAAVYEIVMRMAELVWRR